jgi:hypothetical protein
MACVSISDQLRAHGLLPAREPALAGAGQAMVIELSNATARPRMPVVRAVRDGVHLTFPCPWCRTNHWHGAHDSTRCRDPRCPCPRHIDYHRTRGPCLCPLGTGNGHRAAHCTEPSSPFKATGYVVKEVRATALIWPGQDRQVLTRHAPKALLTEAAALGLDRRQADRLWRTAVGALGGAR